MKRFSMRLLTALTALVLVVALFAGMLTVFAQTGTLTTNNGTRHKLCTALSTKAKAYYTGTYTYDNLSELEGGTTNCLTSVTSPLYTKLQTLMSSTMTKSVSYNSLTSYWEDTDNDRLFYSDVKSGSYNREHVWPKSRASFYQSNGGSDLHHLRPTNQGINSTRGNMTMGNVRGVISSYETADYSGKDVLYYSTSDDLVEVNDNIKGDVARIFLYVYCRWGERNLFMQDPSPLTSSGDTGGNNGKKVIQNLDTLLQWCEMDPVDDWEMGRNDQCENVQGNRNVFIDYPEYAWLLFGQEIPTEMDTPSGEAKNYEPPFAITAESNNAEYGTVSRSGRTVTATPAAGYQIDAANPYTLTPSTAATVTRTSNTFYLADVTADCTLTVNFTAIIYSFSAKSNNTAWGTVSKSGNTVTATAATGYTLDTTTPYTLYPANSATVTQDGNVFTLSKLKANCTLTVNFMVNPCEHPTTRQEVIDPTCTAKGATNTVCTVCGVIVNSVPIAALGHDYQTVVTPPTCTAKGFTTYTCTRCDSSYTKNYTDMLEHDFVDGVCTVCGQTDGTTPPPPPPTVDFDDVKKDAWYAASVQYAVDNELMNGVGNNLFAPDADVTRAMLVTILYRAEKEPSVTGLSNPFTDVPDGKWYTNAVIWAADEGIVKGISETTFEPDTPITREQIAVILHRYNDEPTGTADLTAFPDSESVSAYAVAAMRWAVQEKIINGLSGKLAPREKATRAQLATILMRIGK